MGNSHDSIVFDWGTAFECVKGFVSVLFHLLCYARMGNYDFFNGALILFVTLTVFGFPFLNSNLFACLRFGPWNTNSNLGGSLGQVVLMTAAHTIGAVVAAIAWHDIVKKWGILDKAVDGAVYTSIDGRVENDDDSRAAILFDELVAQAVFLVGVLHIIEATVPEFMRSAAWYSPSEENQKSPTVKHTPIPLTFILYVSLLVAGVTRAFPSAHQSPHVSVYLLMMNGLGTPGISYTACWFRLLGGVLSLAIALPYYWFVYVDRENNEGNYVKTLKRATIVNVPAFMRSELLLPPRRGIH